MQMFTVRDYPTPANFKSLPTEPYGNEWKSNGCSEW